MLQEFLFQPQGIIADRILVGNAAYNSEDSYDLVQDNIDFVNWAISEAKLVRGEFPQEALFSYHTDLYLSQVNNGGHRQFIYNTQTPDLTLNDIDTGLSAMGQEGFLRIFRDFTAALNSEPDLLQSFLKAGHKYHHIKTAATDAFDILDEQFFELNDSCEGEDRLVRANATWLRTLPLLIALPETELAEAKEAICSRNSLFEARKRRSAELKEEAGAKDPLLVFVKALCRKAGLTYIRLTAGSYADDTEIIDWGVCTAEGMRFARVGPTKAALFVTMEGVGRVNPAAEVSIEETDLPKIQKS